MISKFMRWGRCCLVSFGRGLGHNCALVCTSVAARAGRGSFSFPIAVIVGAPTTRHWWIEVQPTTSTTTTTTDEGSTFGTVSEERIYCYLWDLPPKASSRLVHLKNPIPNHVCILSNPYSYSQQITVPSASSTAGPLLWSSGHAAAPFT